MTNSTKIFLTGATGFIGAAVCQSLLHKNFQIVAPVRKCRDFNSENIQTPIISGYKDFSTELSLLTDVETVIHVAAVAHVTGIELEHFIKINTESTLELANAAVKVGVKRFIFISSIGVNGISNTEPFTIDQPPAPVEPYALSKLQAEVGLNEVAAGTGMEVVIIRPPLVYGPNAPGNFGKLLRLVQKNLPLPLGAIDNKRSLVSLDNLVHLIVTCIDHPKAANKTFLVSDDHDLSTTKLIEMMTLAAGKKPRLLPVPVSWLKTVGKLTGKHAVIERLCGSLEVDITFTKESLGWKPPITVDEGIRRCFSVR